MKGFITYTINVGDMPPAEAQALTKQFLDILGAEAPTGWKIIVQPVRHETSRIEIHSLVAGKVRKAKRFVRKSLPQLETAAWNSSCLSFN